MSTNLKMSKILCSSNCWLKFLFNELCFVRICDSPAGTSKFRAIVVRLNGEIRIKKQKFVNNLLQILATGKSVLAVILLILSLIPSDELMWSRNIIICWETRNYHFGSFILFISDVFPGKTESLKCRSGVF